MADLELRIIVRDDGSVALKQFGTESERQLGKTERAAQQAAAAADQLATRGGIALAAFGAALTAIGVKAVKTALQFDAGFREVNTLLNLTGEGYDDLRGRVLALDPALGRSEELVAGLYQTISAGINEPAAALLFVETAAKAAKGGIAELDTAVLAGTKTIEGFGLEATDSQRVFDVLFQTVKLGQTNFQDLATVAGDLAATAGALNISLEENFATLAQLTKTAGSTSQAATQLDGIMRAFIKPAKGMREALHSISVEGHEMGFATGSAAIEAMGLEETLRQLLKQTDGTEVGMGKLFTRAEGLRGLISLSRDDFSGMTDQIEDMAEAYDGAGASTIAYEEQQRSVQASLDTLGSSIERAGIAFGTVFLPPLNAVAGALSIAAQAITGMPKAVQALIAIFGLLLAAVTTLSGAFLLLAPRIVATKLAMAQLGVTSVGTTGALAGTAVQATLTGKAIALTSLAMKGLAVGGALALGVAIGTLINKFVIGENAFANFSDKIGTIAPAVSSADRSMQKLGGRGEEVATQYKFLTGVADRYREMTGERLPESIRQAIAAGESFEEINKRIGTAMSEGTEAGKALGLAVNEQSAAMSAAKTAAADAAAALAEEAAKAAAAEEANRKLKAEADKLAAAMSAIGVDAAPKAIEKIDQFIFVLDNGNISATAAATAYSNIRAELDLLARQYPEVAARLGILSDRFKGNADAAAALTAAFLEKMQPATELIITGGDTLAETNERVAESLKKTQEAAETEAHIAYLLSDAVEESALAAEAAQAEYDMLAKALEDSEGAMSKFFGSIKTGAPWLDSLIGGVGKFIDALTGTGGLGGALDGIGAAISGAFGAGGGTGGAGGMFGGLLQNLFGGGGGGGGLGDLIGGLFGGGGGDDLFGNIGGQLMDPFSGAMAGVGEAGATGLLSGLSGILGQAANFIPIIGPLIGMFAGPLFKGLKALGSKIWGGIKGLFGPSESEMHAREIANSLNQTMIGMLSESQLAEAGGELWAQTSIAIRDAILASGGTEEAAAAAAARLDVARREGPEAAQAAIDALAPIFSEVQSAMDSTGLTLIDLRNKAYNTAQAMGISTAEAFDLLAEHGVEAVNQMRKDAKKATETAAEAAEDLTSTAAGAISDTFAQMSIALGDSTTTIEQKIQETEAWITAAMKAAGEDGTAEIVAMQVELNSLFDQMAGDAEESARDISGAFAKLKPPGWYDPEGGGGGDYGDYQIPKYQTTPGHFRTVPGPPSQPQLAIVHGQEEIGRPGRGGGSQVTINVSVSADILQNRQQVARMADILGNEILGKLERRIFQNVKVN